MAEPAGGGERTHAPTPKRLSDAAKRGDILQSRELGGALALAVFALWLALAGAAAVDGLADMLRGALRFDEGARDGAMTIGAGDWWIPVASLLGGTVAVALAGPALLGALRPRAAALAPKASRLNPGAGFQRMFGPNGLIELGKAVLKVTLLGGIAAAVLMPGWRALASGAATDPAGVARAIGPLLTRLIAALAGGMLLIALIDVPVAWWRRRQRLMMTQQEVRDEMKESEGAPEKKSAIQSRRFAILSRSARKGVAEASVVITNPSHFAVALRYRPGIDAAPVVTARGVDATAAAIRQLATTHGVPVVRQPVLARAVYYTAHRTGTAIDVRLYLAVATLLAWLARADAPGAMPDVAVPRDVTFDAAGRLVS